MNFLLVANPDNGVVKRYELENFRNTGTYKCGLKNISSLTMGSGSTGPALITSGQEPDEFEAGFVDPASLKKLDLDVHWQDAKPPALNQPGMVRCSSDGRLFVFSSQGATHLLTIQSTHVEHTDPGKWAYQVFVTEDGELLSFYAGSRSWLYRNGKFARQRRDETGMYVPGLQAGLHLRLHHVHQEQERFDIIELFAKGIERPFASLPIPSLQNYLRQTSYRYPRMAYDQQVLLSANHQKLAVVLGDEIEVLEFDLQPMLDSVARYYLSIVSSPVTHAKVEKPYVYQIRAVSGNKDLVYALVDGPDGLSVDDQGKVTWRPDVTLTGQDSQGYGFGDQRKPQAGPAFLSNPRLVTGFKLNEGVSTFNWRTTVRTATPWQMPSVVARFDARYSGSWRRLPWLAPRSTAALPVVRRLHVVC